MAQNLSRPLDAPEIILANATVDPQYYNFTGSSPQPVLPTNLTQQFPTSYFAPVADMAGLHANSVQQLHAQYHMSMKNTPGTYSNSFRQPHTPSRAPVANMLGAHVSYMQQPHTSYHTTTQSLSPMPVQKRPRLSDDTVSFSPIQNAPTASHARSGSTPHTSPVAPIANTSRGLNEEDLRGFSSGHPSASVQGPRSAQVYTCIPAPPHTPPHVPITASSTSSAQIQHASHALINDMARIITPDDSPVNAMVRTGSSSSGQSSSPGNQHVPSPVSTAYFSTRPAQRPHVTNNTIKANFPDDSGFNTVSRPSPQFRRQGSSVGLQNTPSRVPVASGNFRPIQPSPRTNHASGSNKADVKNSTPAPENNLGLALSSTATRRSPSSSQGSSELGELQRLEQAKQQQQQQNIARLCEYQKFARTCQRRGVTNVAKEMVRHFRVGKEDVRRDLDGSDVYHVYVDGTGFLYRDVTLTRVDMTGNTNERVLLSIYESDFAPHNYCTHIRIIHGGAKSTHSELLADGTDYRTAFLAFRKAFKKYARLSWEHRLVPQEYVTSSICAWERQQRENLLFAKVGERRREGSRSPSPVFDGKPAAGGGGGGRKRGHKRKASSPGRDADLLTKEERDSCLVRAFRYVPPPDGKAKGEFPQSMGKYPVIPGDDPADGGFVLVIR